MYDARLDVVDLRPTAVVVHSGPGAVEETYRLVVEALS
jgi:hypothetical protein